MDNTTPAVRSAVMSRIRSRNTKPEMVVRQILHASGLRFRLHRKDLPGHPDLVFPSRRVAVFVDGCFWHQHGCYLSHVPASRQEYWGPKLARTRQRDEVNRRSLAQTGWRVLTVWECETRDVKRLASLVAEVRGTPVRKAAMRRLSSVHASGTRGVQRPPNHPFSR